MMITTIRLDKGLRLLSVSLLVSCHHEALVGLTDYVKEKATRAEMRSNDDVCT